MNMKFALAAGVCAAALAGFSDVTSANVVGYMGNQTPASGNKLIAGTFLTVGENQTFKLSDIKGTTEDATGGLLLVVLNSSGSEAVFTQEEADANPALADLVGKKKTFYWWDCEWVEAGWYDSDGEVAWPADDIVFNAGDSFWTIGYGEGFNVAGQVGKNNVTVTTPASGNKAVGNPFPCAIKLSSIYGTTEDATGGLLLVILNSSGSEAVFTQAEADANPALADFVGKKKTFYWWDCEWVEAGWYDSDGEVAWPAESIELPAGEGLWTIGYGEGFVIPAPDAVK